MSLEEHAAKLLDALVQRPSITTGTNLLGQIVQQPQGYELIKLGFDDPADLKGAEIEPHSVVGAAREYAELARALEFYRIFAEIGSHAWRLAAVACVRRIMMELIGPSGLVCRLYGGPFERGASVADGETTDDPGRFAA